MIQPDPSLPGNVLRALAGAMNALRLYPPTSHLPAEAVARFVELCNTSTGQLGHLRFVVESKAFKWGDEVVGTGNVQIEALASALYSHQTGQLLLAPGMTREEVVAFEKCIGRDKAELKDEGGITRALLTAGVSSLAVVEMSVRASTEEGLKGMDLLDTPLDEIGTEIVRATERWTRTSAAGSGVDETAETTEDLAVATSEIAASRMTDALLGLDEDTRMHVLANARQRDGTGKPMEGMLNTIGQMSPAALSRLLMLAAARSDEDPLALLPELELPPDTLRLLTTMLSPSPQPLEDRGVPADPDVDATAGFMAEEDPREEEDLIREISISSPAMAAGRGLATACFLALARDDEESVRAVGEALAPALRVGAFAQVGDALAYLDKVSERPDLAAEASRSKLTLADPGLVYETCMTNDDSLTPEIVTRIVSAAEDVGYDVFISCWTTADEPTRQRLRPALERLVDRIIIAAGRIAHDGIGSASFEAIALLGSLDDSRTVPLLSQLLHSPDPAVRRSALGALADTGGSEGIRSLTDALSHEDRDTRALAAREIARGGFSSAGPALISAVEQYHLVERDVGFKTEVIRSITALGITEAVPMLEQVAGRRFALGSGNKIVRAAAREAIASLKT